jgi:hypothetical protein
MRKNSLFGLSYLEYGSGGGAVGQAAPAAASAAPSTGQASTPQTAQAGGNKPEFLGLAQDGGAVVKVKPNATGQAAPATPPAAPATPPAAPATPPAAPAAASAAPATQQAGNKEISIGLKGG